MLSFVRSCLSVKFSLTFARRVWSDSENKVLSAFCSARRLPSRFSARHIERIITKWCRYSDRFVRILYGLWRNDNVVFTLWRACDNIVTHHVLIVIVCSLATKSACNVSLVVVKELAIHSATVVIFWGKSNRCVLLFSFYCAVLALPRVLFPLHVYIISQNAVCYNDFPPYRLNKPCRVFSCARRRSSIERSPWLKQSFSFWSSEASSQCFCVFNLFFAYRLGARPTASLRSLIGACSAGYRLLWMPSTVNAILSKNACLPVRAYSQACFFLMISSR